MPNPKLVVGDWPYLMRRYWLGTLDLWQMHIMIHGKLCSIS
jgi:hypothetical protein